MTKKTPVYLAAGLAATALLLTACGSSSSPASEPIADIGAEVSAGIATASPSAAPSITPSAAPETTATNSPTAAAEPTTVNTLVDSPLDGVTAKPVTVPLEGSVRLDFPPVPEKTGIAVLNDDLKIATIDFDTSDPTAGYVTVTGQVAGVTRIGVAPAGPGKNAPPTSGYTVYTVTVE